MTARSRVDAVVVGAGIAGLTAARALLAAGLTVSVHEARERVGGRLLSVDEGTGAIDLGATWFWPGEAQVQDLAERLDVAVFEQSLAGDAVFEADARGPQRLRGNPLDVRSSRFRRGAQVLAQRTAAQLPPGALRLADPVAEVRVGHEQAVVRAAGGHVEADHVVLAVPPALAVDRIAFAPALPDRVRTLAAGTAVWMGSVVKAVAVYDTAFWRGAGLAGAAVSHLGPFRELHDHSGPGATPAAIFGFAASDRFSGAPTAQVTAAFTDQLARLFGPRAAEPRRVHVADWSREQWTTPAVPSPRASTSTYGHAWFREPVHGRLHWASTEAAPSHAGHVEGAIRAGLLAAESIQRVTAAPTTATT